MKTTDIHQPLRTATLITVTAALFHLPVTTAAFEAGAVECEATTSFSNRYVSEGISNDPGSNGFAFTDVTATIDTITLGAWWAQSLSTATNEINLFAEYGFELSEVDFFAGVNFLTFPAGDDRNTWELYVSFEYEATPLLTLFGQTYYDIRDIKGGFLELGISTELPIDHWSENLSLSPYALWGIDYGYVSEPRRLKSNHFQFGIDADYALNDTFSVFGSLNHSFRGSNLRTEGEGDVSWFEVGLSAAF